jgi:hypothetical protein
VQGVGYRVQGVGCRVQGVGYRVYGVGCRVQGVGYRVCLIFDCGFAALQPPFLCIRFLPLMLKVSDMRV